MTLHTTTEVFTPATVARVTFVERKEANQRLVYALRTPGKQIVVYGRSGSGKTTLLENKLFQTYERHIKSQCMANTSFEELLLSAFDQLEPYFVREKGSDRKSTKSADMEVQSAIAKVADIRLRLGASTETTTSELAARMLPPQLNPTLLAQLLGQSEACWVIEDLHKAPEDTRRLVAQMMKLFMDAADKSADVRIVVLGAVGSARDIVELDKDMWNRVADIEVGLMSREEIEQIISLGEKALNVRFPAVIKEQIVHYANGLGAVCHQICLNMCMDAEIHETCTETYTFSEEIFATALRSWLADATESLRKSYDVATRTERARRYDNCQVIIQALSAFPPEGATHAQILGKIREGVPDYPTGNLSNYLAELQAPKRGEVVLHDRASGRFFFSSPMFGAYARVAAGRATGGAQQQLSLKFPKGFHKKLAAEFFKTTDSGGIAQWIDVFTSFSSDDQDQADSRIALDGSVTKALAERQAEAARPKYVSRIKRPSKPKRK